MQLRWRGATGRPHLQQFVTVWAILPYHTSMTELDYESAKPAFMRRASIQLLTWAIVDGLAGVGFGVLAVMMVGGPLIMRDPEEPATTGLQWLVAAIMAAIAVAYAVACFIWAVACVHLRRRLLAGEKTCLGDAMRWCRNALILLATVALWPVVLLIAAALSVDEMHLLVLLSLIAGGIVWAVVLVFALLTWYTRRTLRGAMAEGAHF
jgi:hypothetical protein